MARTDIFGNPTEGRGERFGGSSGGGGGTTAAPKLGDIREKVLSNGDIAIQEWTGYAWETIEILPAREGDGGGGGTGSFASSQAGAAFQAEQDRIEREFRAEQERLNREFQAELERKRLEEERRSGLLSTAERLLAGRRESRDIALQRASDLAGSDIFRFLANVKGKQVEAGTLTPIDIFKQQNAAIATSELPSIAPNATIGDLESGIAKMQQMEEQEAQIGTGPFTGFAYGGRMMMDRPMMMGSAPAGWHIMPDGTLMRDSEMGMAYGGRMGGGGVQFGSTKRGVLVGDGVMNGDEEVLVHDAATGEAEVIPLMGGAQAGATFQPAEANLTVLPQLFSTLRGDIIRGSGGNPAVTATSKAGRSALGYLPQGASTGPARFGETGALATPLSIKQGLVESTRYTPEQAQQLSDLIGVLPAPHKAGRFFRTLLPAEKSAIVSAYRLAGFPEADLNAMIEGSAITGPQRIGVSLR